MEYLTLGKVCKTFGLKGELKVYSTTDFSKDRYKKGNKVFLFNEEDNTRIEVEVVKFRKDKPFDIVTFKGLENINLVEKYIGYYVQVVKNTDDLGPDTYFFADLKQCDVYDQNNNFIGKVKEVESYASYNTLRIQRDNEQKDVLVPFVQAFIKNVDIKERKITINVIPGLL